MKVALFDENHEKELEEKINMFIEDNHIINVVDIKYQVAVCSVSVDEQVFCFSAMIIYR